ncbi:C3a anaphylatoxin chemotactic receptor [Tachysurus fulvidraco]|uniref:C3a anaphylatoxin chemotactic receptor n=1 Tax=Tachysurus fulvidraco TaxID=1234273 RepID=UPI001FED40A8|nr:C3a anaphylatoxin chemotactic receptor [Tachysurus fulvidraco]XP_047661217.1 C3a anaphylatoxin chemotactic receptor [Tachysurus fulvidraco]
MNDSLDEDYSYDYDIDLSGTSIKSIEVASLVFYCLTCFLGVPGNALVVWIAGVKMKRTINTIWFLNLAIADLLCCLSIPFTVAVILLKHDWPYGDAMCKVLPTIIVINMFASVFTLNLISLDRFIQVVKPVWAQNNRTIRLAWICCALAWALAILLSLPNLILRKTFTSETFNMTICMFSSRNTTNIDEFSSDKDASYRALTMARFVLGFLIPLLSIVFCYSGISRKVMSSQFHAGRAFRIMLAVVVAFFLSWFPYHVVGLLEVYGGTQEATLAEDLDPLVISFAYANSCMNPIFYVFVGQDFKEKVKLSLRRVFEKAFSEDNTMSSKGQQSYCTNSSNAQL